MAKVKQCVTSTSNKYQTYTAVQAPKSQKNNRILCVTHLEVTVYSKRLKTLLFVVILPLYGTVADWLSDQSVMQKARVRSLSETVELQCGGLEQYYCICAIKACALLNFQRSVL